MKRASVRAVKPGMKTMRWLRRACFLAAALLVAAPVVAPVMAKAADPDEGRPAIWTGVASATAITSQADSKTGVLPVQKPFFAAFPDAGSTWDHDSQYARASTYYPGPTGTAGLNLICDQVMSQIFAPGRLPPNLDDPVCHPAPPFPTVVEADSTTPDARPSGSQALGTGGPLTIDATSAIAHADRTSDYSDAVIGSINVVGLPAVGSSALTFRRQAALILHGPAAAATVKADAADNSTLHIDSAVAHTKQIYDTQGALVVTASSTLQGVSLAGGTIQIDQIKSDAMSRTNGNDITTHSEHLTLSGVTVAGQPASIDQSGVHVGGSATSAKPLTDALNSALKSMGAQISLSTVGGTADTSSSLKSATSEAQGLTFYIERLLPLPNLTDTYFVTFTLGVAGANAKAAPTDESAGEPAGIGGISAPTGDLGSATGGSEGTPGSFIPGTAGTPGSPAFTSTTPRTKRPSVLGRRTAAGQLEADLAGFTMAHKFELLYLAFAFAFAGVCLSSRLLVPRPRQLPSETKVF